MTPFSVIMADTYRFGVTSNAGLTALTPGGPISLFRKWLISSEFLSSTGISSPDIMLKSMVERGAAT